MKVIGLDLSLTSTGIAVVNHSDLFGTSAAVDRIQSKPLGQDLDARARRLKLVTGLILNWSRDADLVVIEGPSYGQGRQGGQHDRAGLWWLTVNHLTSLEIPVVEVPPSTRAKYATGKGNAPKDAVLAAVVRRYPTVDVTGNDEADALVLAAMGARHLGRPIDDLPKTHLATLDAVRWPEREAVAS